jgi:hypothetical protein
LFCCWNESISATKLVGDTSSFGDDEDDDIEEDDSSSASILEKGMRRINEGNASLLIGDMRGSGLVDRDDAHDDIRDDDWDTHGDAATDDDVLMLTPVADANRNFN